MTYNVFGGTLNLAQLKGQGPLQAATTTYLLVDVNTAGYHGY